MGPNCSETVWKSQEICANASKTHEILRAGRPCHYPGELQTLPTNIFCNGYLMTPMEMNQHGRLARVLIARFTRARRPCHYPLLSDELLKLGPGMEGSKALVGGGIFLQVRRL